MRKPFLSPVSPQCPLLTRLSIMLLAKEKYLQSPPPLSQSRQIRMTLELHGNNLLTGLGRGC